MIRAPDESGPQPTRGRNAFRDRQPEARSRLNRGRLARTICGDDNEATVACDSAGALLPYSDPTAQWTGTVSRTDAETGALGEEMPQEVRSPIPVPDDGGRSLHEEVPGFPKGQLISQPARVQVITAPSQAVVSVWLSAESSIS